MLCSLPVVCAAIDVTTISGIEGIVWGEYKLAARACRSVTAQ